MFGYVTVNKHDLSPEQEKRYRAAYCGLCETLEKRHGALARFALNYDFVFLVLLLDSLYEPERRACDARCAAHPFCARRHETSEFTAYAADMTVALYYHKCLDDWRDERNLARRAEASFLKKRYNAVVSLWPRQCEAIGSALSKLQAIERDENASADAAAASFGKITAAIFAPCEDRWAPRLNAFGAALGKFIYISDAWEDCKKDMRRGNFNPLAADCAAPGFDDRCEGILKVLMGECAEEFEKLPLVEDIMLMRNVIYSGIWTRFELKRAWERRRSNADHRSV
jgi:hypothetical protein